MAAFLFHGGLQPSEFDQLSDEDTASLAEELTEIVKGERQLQAAYVELLARAVSSAPRIAL